VNSVEAAKLLGTPDTNNAHPVTKEEPPKGECEYAMVNKANKKVRNVIHHLQDTAVNYFTLAIERGAGHPRAPKAWP